MNRPNGSRLHLTVIDRISRLGGLIGVVVIFVLTLAVTYEVVSRKVFNAPTSWEAEIGRYLLLYVSFLGLAYTQSVDAHVRIESVITRFPYRMRTVLNIITSIAFLSFCAVIVWQGWLMTWDAILHHRVSDTPLAVPLWPVIAVIPVGGFMLCVQIAAKIITQLSPREEEGEEHEIQ